MRSCSYRESSDSKLDEPDESFLGCCLQLGAQYLRGCSGGSSRLGRIVGFDRLCIRRSH
jgi:hypothetical protein